MPLPLPSLSEVRDLIVALGKALLPGLNFGSRRSWHGKRATFISGASTEILFHTQTVAQDLHPLTAGDGKPINDWGNAYRVLRKGATPARKAAAGRVFGAAGVPVDAGQQMRHAESGLLYKIAGSTAIPGVFGVDPESFVDADVEAIDTGSRTRLSAGEQLKFLSTPAGLEGIVKLQLDLDEDGFDDEQFGSYRGRVLSTIGDTASGGNRADFTRWALASLDAAASAYVYPDRGGRGTTHIAVFSAGTGTARSLDPVDRATVLAYIKTKAPLQISGLGGPLKILETVADPQRVEITLETNGILAFAFDWDDSGLLTVAGWSATPRELQFSGPLPASLRAGHRLILDGVASVQDGREYKIEAVSAVDKVILSKAPPHAPAATDKIYSGGPLVTPIRDAIVAHLNGEAVYAGRGLTPIPASKAAPQTPTGPSIVGLDILAEGIGSANPASKYGSWAGGISLGTLYKIVTYKAGVRRAVVVTPATDYEAVDDAHPLLAQIHYVTPGTVVVRRAL